MQRGPGYFLVLFCASLAVPALPQTEQGPEENSSALKRSSTTIAAEGGTRGSAPRGSAPREGVSISAGGRQAMANSMKEKQNVLRRAGSAASGTRATSFSCLEREAERRQQVA